MYYYRARYYDPVRSRFVSEDPIGLLAGTHFYTYAGDNPLRFFDPLGLRLEGIQVRSAETGRSSLTLVNPDNPRDIYYYRLNEPAGAGDPAGSYGTGAALPPGQYMLEPRTGSTGRIIPAGYPVYTTPGNAVGTVIAPGGTMRDWIGPHMGRRSEGCPLMTEDPSVSRSPVRETLRQLIQQHQTRGGTTVEVIEY